MPPRPNEPERPEADGPIIAAVVVDPAAERTRRELIAYETSVRGLGFVYCLWGGFGLFMALRNFPGAVSAFVDLTAGLLPIADCILRTAVAPIMFVLGLRITMFRQGVRRPVIIFSVAIILYVILGALLNRSIVVVLPMIASVTVQAFVLSLMLNPKFTVVCSDEYAEVMRQTSHIRYQPSLRSWVIAGIVIAAVIIGAIVSLFLFAPA